MSQIVDPQNQLNEKAANEAVGRSSNGQPLIGMEQVCEPVLAELGKVETILQSELSNDTPGVKHLLEHSRQIGGKRMRPVFLLLSGASCGRTGEAHLQLAAALEMIHTATLIHDDVLDNAETRRHKPTANSRWGNRASVLLGDFLFTHAFHVASLAGSADALRMLSASSNRVCAGEMHQNAEVGNFQLNEEEYLRIISGKTAELCAGGCAIGAFLSGADERHVSGFESYGRDLGIAFQIIDDVLDLVGSPATVGKTLGTDLLNRKPTLPVIHALRTFDGQTAESLLKLLQSEQPPVDEIVSRLDECGSIEYARNAARQHAGRAIEFANTLAGNEYSRALVAVAEFVLARSY